MSAILSSVLGLAATLPGAFGTASARPIDFQAWFDAARAGRLVIPDEAARQARTYRYVFVAGFANERMPRYFDQNIRELRANGIPRRSIHVIAPSSHRSIDDNSAEVRSRFFAIAREGPEPLVVIAHSRGACDVLAFALRHPDFVGDRVHALFLVQGPFGGTALADVLLGDGPSLGPIPLRHRTLARLLVGLESWCLRHGYHGGMRGLTRASSRAYWADLRTSCVDAVPIVGPRTFYVTSATRPSKLRLFKKATASYLGIHVGANDGLVSPADQSLEGIGRVVAILDVGHSDLTNRFPSSRAQPRLRRALIRAILMTVGSDTEGPPSACALERADRLPHLVRRPRARRR